MSTFTRQAFLALLGLALAAPGLVLAAKPGPAPARYASEYSQMSKDSWRTGFPSLGSYEVLAPSTGREDKAKAYNCIAHTIRVYDRWVWPGNKVSDFDRLYGSHGYRRIKGLDYGFSSGLEKIVLYAKVHKDGRIECTHGCRQLADGTWTSKLGGGPMIRHTVPESVGGPSYGRPIAVYVRARRTAPVGPGVNPSKTPGRPGPSRPVRPGAVVSTLPVPGTVR